MLSLQTFYPLSHLPSSRSCILEREVLTLWPRDTENQIKTSGLRILSILHIVFRPQPCTKEGWGAGEGERIPKEEVGE